MGVEKKFKKETEDPIVASAVTHNDCLGPNSNFDSQ